MTFVEEILVIALCVSRVMAYLHVLKVQIMASSWFRLSHLIPAIVLVATASMEELLASSGQRPEVLSNSLQYTRSLTNPTF